MYVSAYPLTTAFSLLMHTSTDFESWYSGCMRSSGNKFGAITTKIRTKILYQAAVGEGKKDRDQRLKKLAKAEEKRKKEASVTALWESAKIDVDQACKVQPDKRQLLLGLEVTETSVRSNNFCASLCLSLRRGRIMPISSLYFCFSADTLLLQNLSRGIADV